MAPIYGSLDYLRSKMTSWTQESALEFHTEYYKGYPEKSKYIWEEANTDDTEGFVYYGPDMASYFSADGSEYVLSHWFDQLEFDKVWKAGKKLYEDSLNDPDFSIVRPIGFPSGLMGSSYRVMQLDQYAYNYYKLEHPNNELGSLLVFSNSVQTVPEYLNLFINQVTKLIQYAKPIVEDCSSYRNTNDSSGWGYPGIKINDLMTNSSGPYWRFLYKWSMTPTGFYSKVYGELEKMIQHININEQYRNDVPSGILEQASATWKNELNI